MLMICWFYCIPFAKFLYFALGPVVLLLAMFMMKRGVRHARSGLRTASFILMFAAIVKICLFDLRMLKDEMLCTAGSTLAHVACNRGGFVAVELLGLVLMVLGVFWLMRFYRDTLHITKQTVVTPADVGLGFWSKMTMTSVSLMVLWTMAPWAGYLTVGYVPQVFVVVPWQALAVINLFLLVMGFWKAESCLWHHRPGSNRKDHRLDYINNTWTEKDTLWVAVMVYLVTLGLSYVAHDVLGGSLR